MALEQLRLYNFRNIENSVIEFSGKNVFLVGENGQGKTNILESVYIVCYGSSFRCSNDREAIAHTKGEMSLIGKLSLGSSILEISIKISKNKQITIDGNAIEDRKELLECSPCILFCHEDISFVVGTPEGKRKFLNQTLGLCDSVFIDDLRGYNKVLRTRNYILKQRDTGILNAINTQLAELGLSIMRKREDLVGEFKQEFSKMYSDIYGNCIDIDVSYKPSWRNCGSVEDVCRTLEEGRERDLYSGVTSTGPHRDNLLFSREGRDFSKEGSMGQIRLIGLILRVVQARILINRTGRRPLLLLDDVLLELDPVRRGRFINNLPEYEQAVFTFLPGEELLESPPDETLMYRVENGSIHPYEES